MTKQVVIDIAPQFIDKNFVDFIDSNIAAHPGKSKILFQINDREKNLKVTMSTLERGFTMNDEMASFLNDNVNAAVSVATA
jgi:DNA polymerase-3 subunit alpha